jgi:hypothetical protein
VGHLIFPAALAVLAGLLAANPGSAPARRAVTAVAWLSVLFAAVSTGYALANPARMRSGRTASPITPPS